MFGKKCRIASQGVGSAIGTGLVMTICCANELVPAQHATMFGKIKLLFCGTKIRSSQTQNFSSFLRISHCWLPKMWTVEYCVKRFTSVAFIFLLSTATVVFFRADKWALKADYFVPQSSTEPPVFSRLSFFCLFVKEGGGGGSHGYPRTRLATPQIYCCFVLVKLARERKILWLMLRGSHKSTNCWTQA